MGRYEAPERGLLAGVGEWVAGARKAVISAVAGGAFTAVAQVLAGVDLLHADLRALAQPVVAALLTGLLTYWTRNRERPPAD